MGRGLEPCQAPISAPKAVNTTTPAQLLSMPVNDRATFLLRMAFYEDQKISTDNELLALPLWWYLEVCNMQEVIFLIGFLPSSTLSFLSLDIVVFQ